MKYLGIHHLIWFILVLIWTSFEAICYFIYCIIYLLWCFKWVWDWKNFTACEVFDYTWKPHGVRRIIIKNLYDNSIWDTIVRRCKYDLRI